MVTTQLPIKGPPSSSSRPVASKNEAHRTQMRMCPTVLMSVTASEAEPLYKRAIVICENMTPPSSGKLASALSMHAELLDKLTRPAEAKNLHGRSERLINGPQR